MAPCREITDGLAKRPDFAILPQGCGSILEQCEPFAANRVFEIYKTGDIAARVRQIRDKSKLSFIESTTAGICDRRLKIGNINRRGHNLVGKCYGHHLSRTSLHSSSKPRSVLCAMLLGIAITVTRNHGNTLKSARGGNRQKRRIHPANNLLVKPWRAALRHYSPSQSTLKRPVMRSTCSLNARPTHSVEIKREAPHLVIGDTRVLISWCNHTERLSYAVSSARRLNAQGARGSSRTGAVAGSAAAERRASSRIFDHDLYLGWRGRLAGCALSGGRWPSATGRV